MTRDASWATVKRIQQVYEIGSGKTAYPHQAKRRERNFQQKQAETLELSRNGITHQQNIRKQTLLRADLGLRQGELKGQQPKGEARKAFSSYGFLPNIM